MHKMKIIGIILATFFVITINCDAQTTNQVNGNGKKEGKYVKYYDNGKMKYEGQFRNGVPYGNFTHYFNNGKVKAEVAYSDDGVISHTKSYYKNGNLMAVGNYINKVKDSVWMYYLDESGNPMISMETYKNGMLSGESITYYSESGEPAEIVMYENNKKHGKLFKYFPDGVLMTESYYVDGQPHGDFLHYHPDGKLQIRGKYYYGIQAGNWEYFNEDGNPVTEEDFTKQEEVEEIK